MYPIKAHLHILSLFLILFVLSLHSSPMASAADPATPVSDSQCVCGPKRVSVFLFDFSDVTHGSGSTPEYYSGIVRAMNASFYRQSYQKMWIVGGEVYGWYQSSLRLSDLSVTTWQLNWNDAEKLEHLTTHKAQEQHVTGIVFGVFAGPVWGWATGHPSTLTILGETEGLGTFMHEFGHNLGLPDLYNYQNLKAEPVGEWDLMDRGDEELSAYSRLNLGWLPRDSVTTIDSRRDLTLLINSLDSPSGMRGLKVQLYASNSYYLVETRLKADGLHLVIYYIKGIIESGKGSIVIEDVLDAADKSVFVGQRIACAMIILDAQPEGLKVALAREAQGEKAQETFDALKSADESVASAWWSNRVQGLDEAKQELDKAWQSFHNGDFDTARISAEQAEELAKAAKVPESYLQFEANRATIGARFGNASAYKSDEAIHYVDLARSLLNYADGNFTEKNFDIALEDLLEANRTLTKADEAERVFVESHQVASAETQPIPIAVVVASAVIVLVAVIGLSWARRRKAGARYDAQGTCLPFSFQKAPARKFCINCGTSLPADAQTCERCGSMQS